MEWRRLKHSPMNTDDELTIVRVSDDEMELEILVASAICALERAHSVVHASHEWEDETYYPCGGSGLLHEARKGFWQVH